VVVYPNSGETWDAVARRWTGDPGISPDAVPGWVAAGARLVGGCCRVRPEHIERLALLIR
jgi:S-methylmethionine-dependent homocysteine/selenocysteine methylase